MAQKKIRVKVKNQRRRTHSKMFSSEPRKKEQK
jgi:hypothetical protein